MPAVYLIGQMGRLRTPGPGAYDTPANLVIGGKKDTRPSYSFASNSERGKKMGGDQSGDPGAYDFEHVGGHGGRKEPMSARSTRSFNRDINSGKGSFNSSLTRSNSTHSVRAAMDKLAPRGISCATYMRGMDTPWTAVNVSTDFVRLD